MKSALSKKQKIQKANITIYEILDIADSKYLSDRELDHLLRKGLIGLSTAGLANRTRSKVVKSAICEALGYSKPTTFKKTKPRFLGQNFDTYVQKSLNLQIWNEEVSKNRRYVIIQVSNTDQITNVRVINGEELERLDTTGTLTQKFQARLTKLKGIPTIFSKSDSSIVQVCLSKNDYMPVGTSPIAKPQIGKLLPLKEISKRLEPLIGYEFKDLGRDQERTRGGLIHSRVCSLLGYSNHEDNGQFPDILNQLLEVKLQTSPTIDLGLVLPSSQSTFLKIENMNIRHCDVRYAIIIGILKAGKIKISNFALGTGADFFNTFQVFKGIGINKKIQIPLPRDFFSK